MIWLELFGYLGTALVIVSMLMTSVVRLRVINVIGSVISGIYAVLIGAVPMVLMNFCLITINLFNLYRLLHTKRQFEIVKSAGTDAFVQYFLSHNSKDIENFFTEFQAVSCECMTAYMVCCNGDPAGILLGQQDSNGTIDVLIDYSVPAYRDCSVGGYLYQNLPALGVSKLVCAQSAAASHQAYLEKMGFTKTDGQYMKVLQ